MKMKTLLKILTVLFVAKAVFGILYLLFGWEAVLNAWLMPPWLMLVAIIADLYIAYKLYKAKMK